MRRIIFEMLGEEEEEEEDGGRVRERGGIGSG